MGGGWLDPGRMLHPAHTGSGHPQRGRSQSRAPQKEGVEVCGEGDAGGDHCRPRLAGTDPAKPNGVCTGLGSCCRSMVPAQISISN